MEYSEDFAPAIRSILSSARSRPAPAGSRLSVQARSLARAIESTEAAGKTPVIAEVKPTSPTTDGRREDDPVALAKAMVDGGATALSVLTEPDHFGGDPAALTAIRAAVSVPILRKDFILTEAELDRVEADIVLLIARFLEDLEGMIEAARERGFQVLVEVHTAEELERALAAGADIVGINNRDLGQLTVDRETVPRLAPSVPDGVILIAESGITTPDHARRMREVGADALLIGTAIMDGDVTENTKTFVNA